ncbi:hypothetical protein DJ528_10375, partial [Sulfolobus sp. B5]
MDKRELIAFILLTLGIVLDPFLVFFVILSILNKFEEEGFVSTLPHLNAHRLRFRENRVNDGDT